MIKVFSVFDKAAGAYLQPFFMNTKGEALRSFMDALGDEKHQFRRHAPDYSLFYLGEYDEQHGAFLQSNGGPELMGQAHELVAKKENE